MAEMPKIAPVVDLRNADPVRQREYAGLNMAVPEGPPPAPAPEKPSEPVLCPHCRQDTLVGPEEPDVGDKQEFVRTILGGRRYEKKYELFGGARVALESWTAREMEKIYDRLELDAAQNLIKDGDDWTIWLERYRLLLALKSVIAKDGKEVYMRGDKVDPTNSEFWRSLAEEKFLGLSRPLYQALMETGRRFDLHLETLTKRASSRDFWSAVGQS